MTAEDAKRRLTSFASPDVANSSARFFKTGPGQYGEGDIFIGVTTSALHVVAREFVELTLEDVETLLSSPIHEERRLALMILVRQAARRDHGRQIAAYNLYLSNTKFINNWDLVDCSAPQIVGGFLLRKPRERLFDLVKSKCLWERRIAIVSTQHFIRNDDFADTLALSQRLLNDKEPLIHKAAGWMLREVGKKDQDLLREFLDQHASDMPRTMLRHAIERFPPELRKAYLSMKNSSAKEVD